MKFNTAGSAVYGVNDVSIDGARPAAFPAGRNVGLPSWVTNTEIIYRNRTTVFNPFVTQTLTLPSTIATVSSTSCNKTAGGGGVWAKFLTGEGVTSSVSGLGPFAAAMLGAVSPSGQTVVITDAATLSGLVVYDSVGAELYRDDTVTLSSATVYLRDDILSYQDASGWHLVNVTTGDTPTWFPRVDAVTSVIPFLQGSTLYLVETASNVTIRRADLSQGWLLNSTPLFGVDAVSIDADTMRAGGTTSALEEAASLVVFDIDSSNAADLVIRRGTIVAGAVSYGPDTTIPPQDFVTSGQAGSGALEGVAPIPVVGQATVDLKNGQMTREWRMAWNALTDQVSKLGTVVVNTPVTPPASVGFSPIASPGQPDLVPVPGLPLTITSEDGSIDVTLDPSTNTVDLSTAAGGGYWSLVTNGDPVTPELVFTGDGDVISVFVPA